MFAFGMSLEFEVIASGGFGLIAGALSGFLGIGGGAVLPPLLVFTLGIEQHRAQGISLAALLPPVGLPAVLAYKTSGVRILWPLVVALVCGFALGAFGGAWLAHQVPSRELRWGFAAFLMIAALHAAFARAQDASTSHDALQLPAAAPPTWLGLPIGLAAGIMAGLLGIGGGLVAMPLLRKVARLSRLEATATTLAMMLPPIGLPAVFVYAKEQGGLPWPMLGAVMLGFAVGGGFGACLSGRVNERVATYLYAGLIAIMAIALVARG